MISDTRYPLADGSGWVTSLSHDGVHYLIPFEGGASAAPVSRDSAPAASNREAAADAALQSHPMNANLLAFAVEECPVCSCAADATFVVLACRHSFCVECVAAIKRTRPLCPLCREPIVDVHASHAAAAMHDNDNDANAAVPAEWDLAAVRRIRHLHIAPSGTLMVDDGQGGVEACVGAL